VSISSLPAVLGGQPVRPQGPPTWPIPDDDVLAALQAAYRDGSWGAYWGPHVQRLEERLAEYHGLPHVLTCGSGTFAVELALRALKVGPGDEVILAAYDYPGNFLCVHALGATPVLIDVAADNWNLDPTCLDEALGGGAATGRGATKAVIVSHLHGGVVPMTEVMAWAERHGVKVIEDACQCPGATIQGRRAGKWGDVGVLSFGGSKLLTAGRGGAILTRHADVHQRARTHQLRGNVVCPLSELQAAVLLPQLDKLDARNAVRAENVARLKAMPGLRLFVNRVADSVPGYYKLGFQLDPDVFGLSRDKLTTAMKAEGVALDEGFKALHVGRSASRFRRVGALSQAEGADHNSAVLHHPVLLSPTAEIHEVSLALEKVHAYAQQIQSLAE
jgi:perosamine synthetase